MKKELSPKGKKTLERMKQWRTLRQGSNLRRYKKRRFIRAAVRKAVAREVKLGWSDYYPVCPVCGSREVKEIGGNVWNYCPECGQKLKDIDLGRHQNDKV